VFVGALGDGKVFVLDAVDDVVEGGDGAVDGLGVGGEGDIGVAAVLAGVVEVGAADGEAVEAGDDVGVDFELAAVALEFFAVLGVVDVGLFFGFEVDDFDGVVAAGDEVDGAGEDVVVFDEGDVDFGVADVGPVAAVAAVVAEDLVEGDLADVGGEVDALALGEVDVVGVEPGGDLGLGEGVGLAAEDGFVDVFDEVASVEVYPTFTYNTVYYEGDEFWSKISILDDYFYEGNYGSLHGGAVIQNNTNTVLQDSALYATFYDENGKVTSTGNISIDILLPGDTLGVTPWILSPPANANTTEYDILVLPGDVLESYELTENPFTVNEASVVGDYDTDVLVNFTNNYNKSLSEAEVYILLYNAEGLIIGGGSDWTDDPIPAGEKAEIEVWVDYANSQNIDKIRVWVSPNYWTEYK